jgi:hypothetical protein
VQLNQLENDVVHYHEVPDHHQYHNVQRHFQFQHQYIHELLILDAIHQTILDIIYFILLNKNPKYLLQLHHLC